MNQRIIISNNLQADLANAIAECEHDRLFVVTDETTAACCWPILSGYHGLRNAHLIQIPPTDAHKDLQSVTKIWQALEEGNATRHSLIINLGGGMVTDLGGFAASTFKRGVNFINIPTTLLAMVDASVGGKTGINFNGLKNEIGVFNDSLFVILYAPFLKTLDIENLKSGFAEMIKHGLLKDPQMLAALISFDFNANIDYQQLLHMVAASITVKQQVVKSDPHETGLRKALNLGHTFGHAFESFSMTRKPIMHGYAVAYGLVCELYLSCLKCGFPTERMRQVVQFILDTYGRPTFSCDDYEALIQLMQHDKKNIADQINFTLLCDVGQIKIDQIATIDEIKSALDFLREGA